MLIDVHSHLDFEQFDNDREEIIENAKKENCYMITCAVGPKSIGKTLEILENHDNVFATFGSMPEEFNNDTIEETIKLIRKNKDKIVGIGEVGLDYYWVKEDDKRELEKENFQKFISLAKELSLPLVIHSRDAEKDVMEILKKETVKAMLHCFSGSVELAKDAISFGCIISVPTNITYSKQKRALVKEIPLESIVLETDAPFLSPVPKTRNEPRNVKISAEKIAEIKKISFREVAETTAKNAVEFFNLKL